MIRLTEASDSFLPDSRGINSAISDRVQSPLWQLRGVLRVAVQRQPFDGLQQDLAGKIRVNSREQGCVQNAPADDGKQGCCPHEPVKTPELPCLDLASAFRHAMPRFNAPTPRIPGQPLKNIIKRGRSHGTQQHPFDRFNPARRSVFDCVNRKYVHFRQTYRRATQRQTCGALWQILCLRSNWVVISIFFVKPTVIPSSSGEWLLTQEGWSLGAAFGANVWLVEDLSR